MQLSARPWAVVIGPSRFDAAATATTRAPKSFCRSCRPGLYCCLRCGHRWRNGGRLLRRRSGESTSRGESFPTCVAERCLSERSSVAVPREEQLREPCRETGCRPEEEPVPSGRYG